MKTESIRANFPEFTIEYLEGGDVLVYCPKVDKRCGNGHVVHYATWSDASDYQTRPCPYCFKASRIPETKETAWQK